MSRKGNERGLDVRSYYADVTRHYLLYAGTGGFHYGVWEPDVQDLQQALIRSNVMMTRGIEIAPGARVLDIGCGIGSLAVWCGERFGCQVTGITICDEHLPLARELAAERGVSDRCVFSSMDMNSLDFPPGSFDIVLNQETMCYAVDKGLFLAQVYELLSPGGWWSAVEFAVRDGHPGPERSARLRDVFSGWYIPSLWSPEQISAALAAAGFVDRLVEDITPLIDRTSRHIIRHCHAPLLLARLHLDWLFFSRNARVRKTHQGHFLAGYAYSRGLLDLEFRHCLYRGKKPAGETSCAST
jgi:cyclopropane fatty-acyl-phospholipid synthase-like methyltransferase